MCHVKWAYQGVCDYLLSRKNVKCEHQRDSSLGWPLNRARVLVQKPQGLFSVSPLCPCVSQACPCLLSGWTYCKLLSSPSNSWMLLSWDLLAFGGFRQWLNKRTHHGISQWLQCMRRCLISSSVLLHPFSLLDLVWCPRRLPCADCISELPDSQLPVGFGGGSPGGTWRERGERGPGWLSLALCLCAHGVGCLPQLKVSAPVSST